MTYVEGFLTPVPTANRDAYRAHAERAAPLLREFGVVRLVECWSDDVPRGTLNDLWGAVDAQADEAVLFSWFEYPDKVARDAAVQRMMSDPRMAEIGADMPFDAKRMVWGGSRRSTMQGRRRGPATSTAWRSRSRIGKSTASSPRPALRCSPNTERPE